MTPLACQESERMAGVQAISRVGPANVGGANTTRSDHLGWRGCLGTGRSGRPGVVRVNAVLGSGRRMAPPEETIASRLDGVGPFVAELGVAPVFYSLYGPLDLLDPKL